MGVRSGPPTGIQVGSTGPLAYNYTISPIDAFNSRVYSGKVRLEAMSMSAPNFKLYVIAALILAATMYAQAPQQNAPALLHRA